LSASKPCQITGCGRPRIGDIVEYGVKSHIPFCQECMDTINARRAYKEAMDKATAKIRAKPPEETPRKLLDQIADMVHPSRIRNWFKIKENGHG